jgi:putative oxidoreductase
MKPRSVLARIVATNAPRAIILVRVAIAFVFVTEGVQKFLYPDALGVGRFEKIGIPAPDVMAPFVGTVEIVGGLLVLLGLLARLGALALIADMIVAITSTKIPIWIGHGFWGFADPTTRTGFFGMAHEARTDISMLLGCALLFVIGAGQLSLDARWHQRSAT